MRLAREGLRDIATYHKLVLGLVLTLTPLINLSKLAIAFIMWHRPMLTYISI